MNLQTTGHTPAKARAVATAAFAGRLLLAVSVFMAQASHAVPLYVQDPTYSTLTLDVEPTDTVENVKQKTQDVALIPAESQYLYFGGQLIQDGPTLVDYGVTSRSTITLVATSAFATTPLPNTQWSFGVNSMTAGGGIGWTTWQTAGAVDFSAYGNGAITLTVFGYGGRLAGTPAGYAPSSSYTLPFFTATGGISGFSPTQFSITGTFAGFASVSQSGNTLRLEVFAVPGPSGFVLTGLGALVLLITRRRHTRSQRGARLH